MLKEKSMKSRIGLYNRAGMTNNNHYENVISREMFSAAHERYVTSLDRRSFYEEIMQTEKEWFYAR